MEINYFIIRFVNVNKYAKPFLETCLSVIEYFRVLSLSAVKIWVTSSTVRRFCTSGMSPLNVSLQALAQVKRPWELRACGPFFVVVKVRENTEGAYSHCFDTARTISLRIRFCTSVKGAVYRNVSVQDQA
jgi:hypothetical protein